MQLNSDDCPFGPSAYASRSSWSVTPGIAGMSDGARRPKCSRNFSVVPSSVGRPGLAALPTSSISPRPNRDAMAASELTPRTASTPARVTGCLYAMIASDSSAAPLSCRALEAQVALHVRAVVRRRHELHQVAVALHPRAAALAALDELRQRGFDLGARMLQRAHQGADLNRLLGDEEDALDHRRQRVAVKYGDRFMRAFLGGS